MLSRQYSYRCVRFGRATASRLAGALVVATLVVSATGCTIPTDRDTRATDGSATGTASSPGAVRDSDATEGVDPTGTEASSGAQKLGITAEQLHEAIDAVVARYGGNAGAAIAEGTETPPLQAGDLQSGAAWSTSKVPLVMAAERAGVADPELVTAAIARSDNDAAAQLWWNLGGGQSAASAVEAEIAAVVGSSPTVPAEAPREGLSAFGQTQWGLGDQAQFAAGLPGSDVSESVLSAMGAVDPDQSFGLGHIPGVLFKGGWGPEEDGTYTVRQLGLLEGVGVALMVSAPDGSFETGQEMLTSLVEELELA